MTDQLVHRLEQHLDQLLARMEQLEEECARLRAREQAWRRERQQLLEQRDRTQARVEGMIARLKAMEQDA